MKKVNILSKDDLKIEIREGKHNCWQCEKRKASDTHHLDGNHDNNVPQNLAPWCKRCHNEHHGISDNQTVVGILVKSFFDAQKDRMRLENRKRAYKALDYEIPGVDEQIKTFIQIEKGFKKTIRKLVHQEPLWKEYLQCVLGISEEFTAYLMYHIGDPGRFATVSKLWKYYGMDVNENGQAPRKKRNQPAKWHHEARSKLLGDKLIGEQLMIHNDFGKKLYYQYRELYKSKGHEIGIHRRALRKMSKKFLSCLWVRWREIKGLPVSEPWIIAKDAKHTTKYVPEDWMVKK